MPLFLAPLFLIAAAAAIIPIALHLLWQRKPKPVPFSALRFLRAACVKTRRSRRLTQFLVMLLRVLILLLLALAFARPKFMLKSGGAAGNRTLLIVLDCSASMQFKQGDKSSFALARERAERLVGNLAESDKAGLLAPGLPEMRLAFPPTSEKGKLLQALREAKAGFGQINLVQMLNDVLDHLPATVDRKGLEIHIFSDFQKSSWPESELKGLGEKLNRDDMLTLFNVVRPGVTENAGIIKLYPSPSVVVGPSEFKADVVVRATDDFTRSENLKLFLDNQPQETLSIESLAGMSPKETLHGNIKEGSGPVLGKAELDQDAFDLDNVYYFAIPRMAGVPVVLVGAEQVAGSAIGETYFLRAAIQPGGRQSWFLPRLQTWEQFAAQDMEDASIFILCNPPEFSDAVLRKIDRVTATGGTVMLFPGNLGQLSRPRPEVPFLKGITLQERLLGTGQVAQLVGVKKACPLENRIRTIFPMTPFFPILKRLAITTLPPTATPVFEYPDGTPFLVEIPRGSGHILLASVSADRSWSDVPVTPLFLIATQEILREAAGRTQPALATTIGQSVALPWTENLLEANFELGTPAGKTELLSLTRRAVGDPFIVSKFAEPGVYRLTRADTIRLIAVNLHPDECDLTYPEIQRQAGTLAPARVLTARNWQEQEDAVRLAHGGRPLWPALLAAAFFIAIVENFLSNWRSRMGKVQILPARLAALFGGHGAGGSS